MSTNAKQAFKKATLGVRALKAPARSAMGKTGITRKQAETPLKGASLKIWSNDINAHSMGSFVIVFRAPPQERIWVIKQGLPAFHVNFLAERMDTPKELLIDTLRLSRATVNRKARTGQPLSPDESERVLGVEYLIGQVENMVMESGNPEGFDAAKWISSWLNSPLPALNNETPASYMDTIEGQKMVSNLLAMAQSGAYA